MSSAYPPFGGAPGRPCQRCGMPLPPNEVQCRNCGWQNTPMQGNPPSSPTPFNNAWQGGMSPDNSFYQPSPAPMMGNSGRPNMLTQSPTMGNRGSTGPVTNNGSRFAPFSQPPFSQPSFPPPPIPPGPSNPLMNGGYRQSGALPPFNPGALPPGNPFSPIHRRPRLVLIVSLAALAIMIVAGSLLLLLLSGSNTNVQPTQVAVKSIPTPASTPLFADQFASNKNGWNTQSNPGKFNTTVGGGTLTLEDDNHSLLWEMVPGQNGNKLYSDFQLFVDATLTQGDQNNGYGIFMRAALDPNGNDFNEFYRFSLYGDGSFAIYKGITNSSGAVTNSTLVDDTVNSAIQTGGQVNHIVIIAKGSAMTFMVNGQTLSTITDNSYAGGLIALFVNNLTDSKTNAQAKFTNLAIFPAQ
jgi:Domain of Unknown Function (DUF1080)